MEKFNIIFVLFLIELATDFIVLKIFKIEYKKLYLLFLQIPKICSSSLCVFGLLKFWLCVLLVVLSKIIWLIFITDSFRLKKLLSIMFLDIAILFSVLGLTMFLCVWLRVGLETLFLQKFPTNYSFLIVFGIFLYIFVFFNLVRGLEKNKFLKQHLLDVSLSLFGKHIKFYGLVDSGNSLTDPLTKMPVVLISLSSIAKYLSFEEIDWLIEFKSRKINCETVSSERFEIPIFECSDFVISKKNKQVKSRCMIGIVDRKFDGGKFDCLLHRDFM